MRIIKINPRWPLAQTIKQAIEILKKGGVIVFPTDTAYGLGADASNEKAIKRLYKIKGRSFNKPLSVMVSDIKMAGQIAKLDSRAKKIFKKYLPGALTILVVRKRILPNSLTANKSTIGIRIPDNRVCKGLVKGLKRPITATSANIAGKGACYSIKAVLKQFKGKKFQPDLMIDAGYIPGRKISTIIDLSGKKSKIIREGAVKII